jgi:hypothetical protein
MSLSRSIQFVSFALVLFTQPGCFFYSGVSTINKQTQASGSGFLTASERGGQWEADGPPPRVGEVTDRQISHKMGTETTFSILGSTKEFELGEPYPSRRRRIVAIREVGTSTESDRTIHYYEVEFDPEPAP